MTRTRTALLVTGAALGLVLLPGCSTGKPSTQTVGPATQNASVRLNVSTVSNLGQVVTDGNGRTLYRFDKDSAKPPVSNCNGDCAAKWPPVIATTDAVSLQGVDQSLVGLVTRQDGSKQVTLAGWPLYLFAQDTAPGDAKGQGVGGTWFAATPQGKKAAAQPAAAPPPGY